MCSAARALGAAHEQAHRVVAGREHLERPRRECEQVGGEGPGARKARVAGPLLDRGSVGHRAPAARQGERQREATLEIGLVEAGKDAARVGGHEERVHVARSVLTVPVERQRAAGHGDRRPDLELDAVGPALERRARHHEVLARVPGAHRLAVHAQAAHRRAAPVEDQVGAARERHAQVQPAAHAAAARIEAQLERVARIAVVRRAPARELLGDAGLEPGRALRGGGRGERRRQHEQRGAGMHAAQYRRGGRAQRSSRA